jgi:hypothetical protein
MVRAAETTPANFKVTTPHDLRVAEAARRALSAYAAAAAVICVRIWEGPSEGATARCHAAATTRAPYFLHGCRAYRGGGPSDRVSARW